MENRAEQRRRAVLEALTRATEPLIAARAKENQKVRKGNQPGAEATSQKSAKLDKPIDTREEAAALAGVSHDTFHKGKVALNHGSTPTPVGSGTPTLGGQDQRTTDGEAHGQGQG